MFQSTNQCRSTQDFLAGEMIWHDMKWPVELPTSSSTTRLIIATDFVFQVCQLPFMMLLLSRQFPKCWTQPWTETVISSMNQATWYQAYHLHGAHGIMPHDRWPSLAIAGPGPLRVCSQDLARGQSACDPGRFHNKRSGALGHWTQTTWIVGSVHLYYLSIYLSNLI